MTDAGWLQRLERLPDVLRPGPLPGVWHGRQPRIDRLPHQMRVPIDRLTLAAGGVDRHHAASRVLQRDLERAEVAFLVEVADEVRLQPSHDPVVTFAGREPVEHGLDRSEPVAQTTRVLRRREDHLGVPDPLCRKVSTELQRHAAEVVQVVEQVAHLAVGVDEVCEPVEAPDAVRSLAPPARDVRSDRPARAPCRPGSIPPDGYGAPPWATTPGLASTDGSVVRAC